VIVDPASPPTSRLDAAQFEAYLRRELASLARAPAGAKGGWQRSRRRARLESALEWLGAEPPPRRAYALRSAARGGLAVGSVLVVVDLLFDGFPRPGGWMPTIATALAQIGLLYVVFYVMADRDWQRWRQHVLASYAEAERSLTPGPHGPGR